MPSPEADAAIGLLAHAAEMPGRDRPDVVIGMALTYATLAQVKATEKLELAVQRAINLGVR